MILSSQGNSRFEDDTIALSVKRAVVIIVFVLGLIYILLPGSKSINDFPPLPSSVKSQFEGDTTQNPNIAAYFANFRREYVTKYYKNIFSKKLLYFIPLPVISLNHRPEMAYQYVRDQQESTFLEEYVFPIRESIFVNGYDPEIQNKMLGRKQGFIGNHILYNKGYYETKTTLRFYPSSVFHRIIVYLGIWLSAWWLLLLLRKSRLEQ